MYSGMGSSRKPPRLADGLQPNGVHQATEEPQSERSPVQKYLAEIGRKGGLKGGKARAAGLSPRKRSAIAKRAAEARWKKKK